MQKILSQKFFRCVPISKSVKVTTLMKNRVGMLNFRKLRQDFSQNVIKEGKELHDKGSVIGAKILHFDKDTLKIASKVRGVYDNTYESEIEIDRNESVAVDSNCDCTYTYDCQHIAAILFYLEQYLDAMVVAYFKETDLEQCETEVKEELQQTFEEAASKEHLRKGQAYQKEVLHEYIHAAKVLAQSPFFLPTEVLEEDKAELAVIFTSLSQDSCNSKHLPEIQIALRLQGRSKPLLVSNVKAFLEGVRYREPIQLGGKKYYFTLQSFDPMSQEILKMLVESARFHATSTEERYLRVAQIDVEAIGTLLWRTYDLAIQKTMLSSSIGRDFLPLPCLYSGNLEEPLCYSHFPSHIRFVLDYLEAPGPTILLNPTLIVEEDTVALSDILLFESAKPGLIYKNTYYRFQPQIKRTHLKSLIEMREVSIPEPLFGTFIESGLPLLKQYAEVTNTHVIEKCTTLPYTGALKGRCEINYLNGELEAELYFLYDQMEVPSCHTKLAFKHLAHFTGEEGILARNLVEERMLVEDIFQDFLFDEKEKVYRIKSEKKIVEFMTETIPRTQHLIDYACPENLSEQFIYDESSFELHFRECEKVDVYEVALKVNGYLNGVSLDLLWECIASKKRFVELDVPANKGKKGTRTKMPRILVLDLDKIAPIVQIFDEIGLKKLQDNSEYRPLWSLASVHPHQFANLPITFSMTEKLKDIQKQIFGEKSLEVGGIPAQIKASLRKYQTEGVQWLEKLRKMHLNGILADDMGLGKTLQAIIAITQSKIEKKEGQSLIVCPTSLVYNWKEEFHKFNPDLKVTVIDSTPNQRKKLLKESVNYDVVITSYNLLQKDIDAYKDFYFDYAILDEAQHIKNRGTRNAKSVKMVRATHRLILTGTPIENSLEELWSLFDFLMPGLLSSYERFVEKYIRQLGMPTKENHLEMLRKKVSPFILRRMKEDVLDDLPPVSEIVYHCHLTDTQKHLYQTYAASAKEELSRLVQKEGFDKIQIHVLATLTRLKQICCHPAIFAKEKVEAGDSAKYELLMELLRSLTDGNHKTVIFSQYTKMLTILRDDLQQQGIRFSYLDGTSKNRVNIVKEFNEDPNISIFLVSLKAGGTGLNLVGADTVIHYDMWWNPAVENQATDRVHRIGQKKSVSSYKLVTLNTIEEKIVGLQNKKKGLVKSVIGSDEEAMAKLTWEEVLELLQT